MDEVQSWWEVPTVAHFCYVFRAAFNLLYIDIGELEAAILNIQDPEMCISLEQLVIRILQGCYEEGEVTSENWEEKLHELFDDNYEEEEHPLKQSPFSFLTPRSKVEVLLKLCECRLDVVDDLDALKDIPAEAMQAKCVGKDNQNNVYWYFCDERLYKEDPSAIIEKSGKQNSQTNSKNSKKSTTRNKKKPPAKEKKIDSVKNNSWSIACHNLSDWEMLMKKFSKSKHAVEKELAKEIKDKYLPLLADVIAEKDRNLRKRFLELQPKRTSSRISKLQAQQKLEEQIAVEAAEKRQKKLLEEEARREARRKKEEIESRRKRAEEREKKIRERSLRAKQREQARYEEASEDEEFETSDEGDDKNEESSENDSESESESSPKEDSSDSENEEDSNGEESENNNSTNMYSRPNRTSANSVPPREIIQRNFVRSNVTRKPYDFTKWNSQVDSKGHKIHILHYPYDELLSKKVKNSDNTKSYQIGENKNIPSNDYKAAPYYKDNNRYHPFRQRNLNSCTKESPSSSLIRIDFIKPPANHPVSS